MPDYRRMYYLLRAGVSSVLDDMRADGEFQSIYQRLETLLQEAEEVYIETSNVIPLADQSEKNAGAK